MIIAELTQFSEDRFCALFICGSVVFVSGLLGS